jgi:hypothetical protein
MRRLIFLFVLFIGSQLYAQKIFNLGLHAGVNVSTLSTNIPDYFSSANAGFRGGIFARINIKKFHIQPELNFSMVGSEGSFAENPARYFSARANTLEVPLLFGYKIIDFKLINIRLQAGGFFAYNLSKSIKVHDQDYPQNDSTISSSNAPDYNGGIVVGAGADIWRFTLDFRYQWAFANMYGSNIVVGNPTANFKTGTFSVTFGYKFF